MMEQFKYNFNKSKHLTTIITFLTYSSWEEEQPLTPILYGNLKTMLPSMMQTISSTGSIVVACLRHRHHLSLIVVWNDKS